jgi:hypothetical protein
MKFNPISSLLLRRMLMKEQLQPPQQENHQKMKLKEILRTMVNKQSLNVGGYLHLQGTLSS